MQIRAKCKTLLLFKQIQALDDNYVVTAGWKFGMV
jgi:hypothetical protein